MNKLFTKIAGSIIGMAMAIGVGVAVGRGEVRQAKAVETVVGTFGLGDNGSASHSDGSAATTYSETNGGYTLNVTGSGKFYTGATDATGNGCFKLGTSSAAGSFSFTAPSDITTVKIYVAAYKTTAAKISINSGDAQTISSASNDGNYTAVSVNTSSSKSVSLTTVSGGYRAMINTIEFLKDNGQGSVAVSSVSITKDSTTLTVGEEETLAFTVLPDNATNKALTWTSSNEAAATVNSSGKIIAVDAGETTITATSQDGSNKSDTCTVTVSLPSYIDKTVAQARTIAEGLSNNETTTDYYRVEGFVTEVTEAYNPSYGNISFTIADEKGGSSNILCFRIKCDSDFAEDIIPTAKIRMIGQIQKYVKDTTTKFEIVNVLPSTLEITIAGDTVVVHDATFAEVLAEFDGMSSGDTSTDKYTLSGVVTNITNAYANGKISFNIVADDNSNETILVYNLVVDSGVAATIVEHAIVELTGYLKLYNTTKEIINGEEVTVTTRYGVTYNANGATDGTAPTDSSYYSSGATVTVLGNTGSLVKTGYTFGGWNTAADGNGTDRAAGSQFNITANTTLFAKWVAKTLTSIRAADGTPNKVRYIAGQRFSYDGLTIYASFDGVEDTSINIAPLMVWNNDLALTGGLTSVEGSYTSGGVTKTITISGLTVAASTTDGSGQYHLANQSDIGVGAHIVIAAGDAETGFAMGNYAGANNFPRVAETKNSNGTITTNNAIELELVAGTVANSYGLKIVTAGDYKDQYVYAAGASSSNNMKAKETLDETGSFVFEKVSDSNWSIVSQMSGTRNTMRYNSNSSLFSCYAASNTMADVTVYVFVSYEVEAANFADYFLEQTDGYCSESLSSSVKSDLLAKYNALTDVSEKGAKQLFTSAAIVRGKGQSYSNSISEALSRYVNMIEEGRETNFLGLSDSVLNKSSMIISEQYSTNNVAIIITVISVLSLTALGGFFFIKKRKEQ